MRPAEYTAEEIVNAGRELQAAGRNITGFALRQKVGGGNPTRLRQVWTEHQEQSASTKAEPVAELPIEVAEELATVTKALTDRLAALAVELNGKAVKAAERRVTEVVRTAGEQREQAERELADASQTVEDLERQLDGLTSERDAFARQLSEAQATSQAQALELAQLRERLSGQQQEAEQMRGELASQRLTAQSVMTERDQARLELATAKANAEADLRQAREETALHRAACEKAESALATLRTEHAQGQQQASQAREETANLRGQVQALQAQAADMLRAMTPAPVSESEPVRDPNTVDAFNGKTDGEATPSEAQPRKTPASKTAKPRKA